MYLYYILQEGAQNGFDGMFREIDIDFTKFFVKLLSRKKQLFYLFEDRGHHGRFIITQINTRTSSTVKCCSQLVYFGLDS